MTVRVLLAEDHLLVRAGIRALLSAFSDMEVVGEVTSGIEAVEAVASLAPDVVLLDISMHGMNGLEAARRIASGPSGGVGLIRPRARRSSVNAVFLIDAET